MWMSFFEIHMVQKNPPFIGLRNYLVVMSDLQFWIQVRTTLIWTFSNIAIIAVLGVVIALLLNADCMASTIGKRLVLYPWIFPVVATTLMWRWMLEPEGGVLNLILTSLHITDHKLIFLSDVHLALPLVIIYNIWRWTPFLVVIAIAALQSVSIELYEAARIDGVNNIQLFFDITLPQIIRPISVSLFILSMWVINQFPPIWLLTEGGPMDVTTTLPVAIYRDAFEVFDTSIAATKSVLLLLIAGVLAFVYAMISRRDN
jgi:ABC-type sugar transport system permease subunit